jgi:hypothetical protein
MKTYIKLTLLAIASILMYMIDPSPRFPAPGIQLINEAQAVFGVRRRSVAVGYTMGAAQAQQQAAPATTPAPAPAPAAAPAGTAPPVGSVVSALPAGCVSAPKGGVQYFNCGGVYYRTAFQGNNLVYVVTQP